MESSDGELEEYCKYLYDHFQHTGYTCHICEITFPYRSKLITHEKTANHQMLAAFLSSAQSNADHTAYDIVEDDEVYYMITKCIQF